MKRFLCVVIASVCVFPASVEAREVVRVVPHRWVHPELFEPVQPLFGVWDAPIMEILADETCFEWTGVAIRAGWQPDELPRLMRIMFRESRCQPDACGLTDSPHLRKCRDWGLMQINDYSWKTTIRNMGLSIEQMWDPYWNLWFARWLFETSMEANGDGWHPWRLTK